MMVGGVIMALREDVGLAWFVVGGGTGIGCVVG